MVAFAPMDNGTPAFIIANTLTQTMTEYSPAHMREPRVSNGSVHEPSPLNNSVSGDHVKEKDESASPETCSTRYDALQKTTAQGDSMINSVISLAQQLPGIRLFRGTTDILKDKSNTENVRPRLRVDLEKRVELHATTISSPAVNPPSETIAETLPTGSIRVDFPSLKIARLKKNHYIGKLREVRPPVDIEKKWYDELLPRLLTDLQSITDSNPPTQSYATLIEPQLCMSGLAVKDAGHVILSPCIWIRCSNKRCKEDVDKVVKNLSWLKQFRVEVHIRSPVFTTADSNQLIDGLNLENGFECPDGSILYIHIEDAPAASSSCGLLCVATIVKGGLIHQQRVFRIGGLVYVNYSNLYGVTTAHGVWADWSDDAQTDVDYVSDSDETDCDSHDSQSGNNSMVNIDMQPLGVIQTHRVNTWKSAWFQSSNFLGTGNLPSGMHSMLKPLYDSAPKDADLALLDTESIYKNYYIPNNSVPQAVDNFLCDNDLDEGPVKLLFSFNEVLEGYLLPMPSMFLIQGVIFQTRKIELQRQLAPGTSGTWVVRKNALCGMVIASYATEPYAHIITAEKLLKDIIRSNPQISHAVIPPPPVIDKFLSSMKSSESTKAVSYGSLGQGKEDEELEPQGTEKSENALGKAIAFHNQGKYEEAEAMYRQALAGCETVPGVDHPDTLTSINNLGSVLERQGKYEEAEAMHRQALAGCETILGVNHPDTLMTINYLGRVLERQGKYEEAEAMHRQVLAGCETVLGVDHLDVLMTINNLGRVLNRRGKYKEAEAMHRRALAGYETVLGTNHPNTLMSINNIGGVLDRQGKYKEAETMHRRALAGCEIVLGNNHPNTLTSINNLGSVLERQGKYEEAEAMHRQALAGCEIVLGINHPNTLTSINNLGLVLERQGKYEEAEAMHRQALARCETVLGVDRPDTLITVNNLGGVLDRQGKYKEAEAMYRQALAGYETVLGTDHPNTLTSINNLGSVLERQGKYEEAEAMHRQALAGCETVLGVNHPITLMTINNIGGVFDSQGKYKEAEAMYRQALAGCEIVLGINHPNTLTSINNLGLVLERQGKYEEAEAMHRQALAGCETVLGVDHPDTLITVNNLGGVLDRQGKYKEAEAMYRQALAGYETVLGTDHPNAIASINNIGGVLDKQGKYKEAESMHRRALAGYETVLGTDHPNTLMSLSNLGWVLGSQGKDKEAEAMHQRALAARETVLGVNHPDTLTSVNNLGSVLERQGKYEEAKAMHQHALAAREMVLGVEHPDTLMSINNLGSVLERQGRDKEAEAMYQQALAGYKTVLGINHPNALTGVNNLGTVLNSQENYKKTETTYQRVRAECETVLGTDHPITLTAK